MCQNGVSEHQCTAAAADDGDDDDDEADKDVSDVMSNKLDSHTANDTADAGLTVAAAD